MDLGHAALGFASAFCYAAAAACYAAMEAHVAGYTTWLAGGSHEDAFGNMLQAGAIAFVSAAGNQAIGQTFNISGATVSNGARIGNVLAHAALGCAMAEAGGGKCGAGALSAAITAGVDQIHTDSFSGGFAMAMVAGCAGSAAGGGSCSRGAASSAIIYLYNSQGGGAGPVIKGQAGVDLAIQTLTVQGDIIVGTQISARTEYGGVVLDILYIDHEDGRFRFAEVKNGPYADFSATQKQRYGEVSAGNWIPFGPRAIGANLLPGVSMGGIPASQWGGMNYMHFHGEPRTSIWNKILNGR